MKLTAEKVRAIRNLLAAGAATQLELAERYGVTKQAVNRIAKRLTWKEAGGPEIITVRPRTNTGYWGVSANGAGNRFIVILRHEWVAYRLGTFRDADTAARAYDARARELGFPPEKLNFPDDHR